MEELLFTSIIQKLKNFSAILSKCDWLATAEVKSIWVQEADEGIESETILQWDDLRRLSKLSKLSSKFALFFLQCQPKSSILLTIP